MKDNKWTRKVVLEDGAVFTGFGFGSPSDKKVEIVFNTSMVGYQEILSDPSYTDQAVVMTYPLIGNYGMCDEDNETITPTIAGMIVREYCDQPSNFRQSMTLDTVMKKYDIVGVEGIDTRKLARHIRDFGSCKAAILPGDYDDAQAVAELKAWVPAHDQVARVSTPNVYEYHESKASLLASPEAYSMIEEGKKRFERLAAADGKDMSELKPFHVVAIDCGIKHNILRSMVRKGLRVTVVPWNTTAETILSYHPDGVFISNGPGDPTDVQEPISAIRDLIGKVPIFGICLGHQIISLAYGAKTYKLKFGHRGGNHPVKNLANGKLEITSQNHSYAVDTESVKNTRLQVSHINLLDQTVEGVKCPEDFCFSVQYHPESAPGPQDSSYLFNRFIDQMRAWKEAQ